MQEVVKYSTFDGLDATGKQTITDLLQATHRAQIIHTPPEWMKPIRRVFDKSNVNVRFIYYAYGNLWTDRKLLRPTLEGAGDYDTILQDRSWLSTLAAHELRGVAKQFLLVGTFLARTCVRPSVSLIIHVDKKERHQRLKQRGFLAPSDRENLKYEDSMEQGYQKWGMVLNWKTTKFDNTNLTPEESSSIIFDLIWGTNSGQVRKE